MNLESLIPRLSAVAAAVVVALLATGCASPTSIALATSPSARLHGHYRAEHVDTDFSCTGNARIDLGRDTLREFRLEKESPNEPAHLEIRERGKLVVNVTAEPGTRAVRATNDGRWTVETVR